MRLIKPADNKYNFYRCSWSDGTSNISTWEHSAEKIVNGQWEMAHVDDLGPGIWEVHFRPECVVDRNHASCCVHDPVTGEAIQFIEISATNFLPLMVKVMDGEIPLVDVPNIGKCVRANLTNSRHHFWTPAP